MANYTCVAENIAGKRSADPVSLTVYGKYSSHSINYNFIWVSGKFSFDVVGIPSSNKQQWWYPQLKWINKNSSELLRSTIIHENIIQNLVFYFYPLNLFEKFDVISMWMHFVYFIKWNSPIVKSHTHTNIDIHMLLSQSFVIEKKQHNEKYEWAWNSSRNHKYRQSNCLTSRREKNCHLWHTIIIQTRKWLYLNE